MGDLVSPMASFRGAGDRCWNSGSPIKYGRSGIPTCTVSEIFALIFQNFNKSCDPKCTPILCNFNMHMVIFLAINLHTKFEMLASSTPVIWQGFHNVETSGLKKLSDEVLVWFMWPWPRPFGGQLVIRMINSYTKFEVSSFSDFTDISGGEKF